MLFTIMSIQRERENRNGKPSLLKRKQKQGKGYIEVHHIRPLSFLDEEVAVDPAEDLVCLCANCHRMMHRTRAEAITVEELKRIFCP